MISSGDHPHSGERSEKGSDMYIKEVLAMMATDGQLMKGYIRAARVATECKVSFLKGDNSAYLLWLRANSEERRLEAEIERRTMLIHDKGHYPRRHRDD